MFIIVLSKMMGFLKEISLSYIYGAGKISDIYIISTTIPVVIFSLVMMGISTGYIPLYMEIKEKKGKKDSIFFTNNLINIVIVISLILTIVCLIFNKELVRIFASGFEGETLELTLKFTKFSLFSMLFIGINAILVGYLQVNENYKIPAISGIFFNGLGILVIIFSSHTKLVYLIVGSVLILMLQTIYLYIFSKKNGYFYKMIYDLNDKNIKKIIKLSTPLILGVSVNQINILVDRSLASRIEVGGISALAYSSKINLLVIALFVEATCIVAFPKYSKLVAQEKYIELKKELRENFKIISIFLIPSSVGLMFFSQEIINFLFKRGSFTQEAVSITAGALFFYSIGILGVGYRDVLAKLFYALKDTKSPMMNATIAVICNIMLNIIFSYKMGINGLALATSFSSIFCAILLARSLEKKIGNLGLRGIFYTLIKILFSSIIMGVMSKILYYYLVKIINHELSIVLTVIFAIGVYIGMILLFNIIDLKKIKKLQKKINI